MKLIFAVFQSLYLAFYFTIHAKLKWSNWSNQNMNLFLAQTTQTCHFFKHFWNKICTVFFWIKNLQSANFHPNIWFSFWIRTLQRRKYRFILELGLRNVKLQKIKEGDKQNTLKGQIISEHICGVLNIPKMQRNYC